MGTEGGRAGAGPQAEGSAAEGSAAAEEKCEFCAAVIPSEHGHVADLEQSSLMCACRACYLLFTHGQAGRGRYRSVPDRYAVDPDRPMTAAEWDMLDIPVGLAFFLRSSAAGEVTGFYPSPAGATQCRLDLAAWDRLAADHPLLAVLAPDVEAALICRTDTSVEHFLVPVDVCYELAGRMRLHWRGFDGGEQARAEHRRVPRQGPLACPALGWGGGVRASRARGGGVRASTGPGALTWPSLPSTASGPG